MGAVARMCMALSNESAGPHPSPLRRPCLIGTVFIRIGNISCPEGNGTRLPPWQCLRDWDDEGGSTRGKLLALPPHPLVQHFSRRRPDALEPKPHAGRRRIGLVAPSPHHLAGATDRRLPVRQHKFDGKMIAGFEPFGCRHHQTAEAQIFRVAEEDPVIPFALHLQHQQGRGQPVATVSRDKWARFARCCRAGSLASRGSPRGVPRRFPRRVPRRFRCPPFGCPATRWSALTAHQ